MTNHGTGNCLCLIAAIKICAMTHSLPKTLICLKRNPLLLTFLQSFYNHAVYLEMSCFFVVPKEFLKRMFLTVTLNKKKYIQHKNIPMNSYGSVKSSQMDILLVVSQWVGTESTNCFFFKQCQMKKKQLKKYYESLILIFLYLHSSILIHLHKSFVYFLQVLRKCCKTVLVNNFSSYLR